MQIRLLAAAAAALALTSAANADLFFFDTVDGISGDNEVPPTGSPATGTFSGVYDDVANTFSFEWSITDNLLGSPTGAHIHSAPAGVNGGIVFPFASGGWPLDGQAVWTGLSSQNVDDLFSQGLYINFHTTAFPGGEIRGQISLIPTPAAAALLGLGGIAGLSRRRR